jgi:hypothetical protein
VTKAISVDVTGVRNSGSSSDSVATTRTTTTPTGRRKARHRRPAAPSRVHLTGRRRHGCCGRREGDATFSKAIDPATLTSSTFSLTKSGRRARLAVVRPCNLQGVLHPSPALAYSTTYSAKIRWQHGYQGHDRQRTRRRPHVVVHDGRAAPCRLRLPAASASPPSGSTFLSDLLIQASNGWGPPEKDKANGGRAR